MAKLTMVFGFVLVALGVTVWMATGRVAPTALIPAWFGIVMMLAGALARTEDAKKRMLWMHVAASVGLFGLLLPAIRASMALGQARSTGLPLAHPDAVKEELVMAVVCLFFVIMCARSFVKARRSPGV
ncbi:MAG: hypothetical protein V4555_03555 [Acidobacteriota bacterium]